MPQDELQLPLPLPLQVMLTVVICGNLLAWLLIVRRIFQQRPLVAYEPRRPVPWSGTDLAAVLCVLILLSFSARQFLLNYYGGAIPATPGPADLAANLAVELMAVILAAAFVMFRAGATIADLGLNTARLAHYVGLGALAYLAVIAPITLLQTALSHLEPYQHKLIDAYRLRHDAMMITWTTAAAVFVAPLCEELLFRVLLQGWFEALESAWHGSQAPDSAVQEDLYAAGTSGNAELQRRRAGWPTLLSWWPILLSSELFALMHWGQGLAPIPLFFLALVLGYLYRQTHRLWPSLVVHMLLNAGTMMILWWQISATAKHVGP